MRSIGVDVTEGLVYDGDNNRGRGVLPTPMLFVSTLLEQDLSAAKIPDDSDLGFAQLLFREDSFDASTRLRRGRFYERAGISQPQQWYVLPHPGTIHDAGHFPTMGVAPRMLHGFRAFQARRTLKSGSRPSIVAFGSRSAYSLWRVVDVELTVTGEDFVTLRARSSLGLLPELREAVVPPEALPKVKESLETLVVSAYGSAPSSVIDRARDVALTCVGAWLASKTGDAKMRTKELAELAKSAESENHVLAASAVRSIARLHADAKPNVQQLKSARPPMEADAEFSLAAVGLILRDIGWANY